MRDIHDEIRDAGARLAVVGNGQPEHARAFREDQAIPFDLWVDPEMKAYEAAGLRRGFSKTMSIRSPRHLYRAMRKGFRQTAVQGDPWQLGGAFVVTQHGEIVYEHVSREAGDHPPPSELLTALHRAS